MTRYRNPWHNRQDNSLGPEFYETDARPVLHQGYLIFHRLSEVWDIVKDGVCICQRAGYSGAIDFIRQLNADPATLTEAERAFVARAKSYLPKETQP